MKRATVHNNSAENLVILGIIIQQKIDQHYGIQVKISKSQL